MTRKQIILRPPSSNRRQPLLASKSSKGSSRFAEVAGATTAECAAVCCCCPCGLMNLLVLAVYKLPAGLCRKALQKRRKHRLNGTPAGLFPQRRGCTCGCVQTELQIHPLSVEVEMIQVDKSEKADALSEKELMELENEMWDRFYSTGFWRSPSQREEQET